MTDPAIAGLANAIGEALLPQLIDELAEKLPAILANKELQGEQDMSPTQIAKLCKCRKSLVYEAMDSGALPSRTQGRGRVATAADARTWKQTLKGRN